MIKILKDTNKTWAVRICKAGDRRFPGNPHNTSLCEGQWEIQFYDTDTDHCDLGQFVSNYNLLTLLNGFNRKESMGLNLDGGVPAWSVSAVAMDKIRVWLKQFADDYVQQVMESMSYPLLEERATALEDWGRGNRTPFVDNVPDVAHIVLKLGLSPEAAASAVEESNYAA